MIERLGIPQGLFRALALRNIKEHSLRAHDSAIGAENRRSHNVKITQRARHVEVRFFQFERLSGLHDSLIVGGNFFSEPFPCYFRSVFAQEMLRTLP